MLGLVSWTCSNHLWMREAWNHKAGRSGQPFCLLFCPAEHSYWRVQLVPDAFSPRLVHWTLWTVPHTLVWGWTQSPQCLLTQSLGLWWGSPAAHIKMDVRLSPDCSTHTASEPLWKTWWDFALSTSVCTHLPIDHVRDHHDLVGLCIWKLQRQFGGLNVKGQNYRILWSNKTLIRMSSRPSQLINTHHHNIIFTLQMAMVLPIK